MTLTVRLPDNNQAERRYVVELLLGGYLGLPHQLVFSAGAADTVLTLENGNSLVVADAFFSSHPEPLSYLHASHLPKAWPFLEPHRNPLTRTRLPVIFGQAQLEVSDKTGHCGIDLFAGAFFLLTRWEETVVNDRDEHGRFPARAALASQHGVLQLPIVDLYADLLWALLHALGLQAVRKHRPFSVLLTHDVDAALLWPHWAALGKRLLGDVLKRGDLAAARFSLRSGLATRLLGKRDPYDTFDWLMDGAERAGLRSHFFFLCGGKTRFDRGVVPIRSRFVQDLIQKIRLRGHGVGLHPSYGTLRSGGLLQAEKQALQAAAGMEITASRQHFLRFEVPTTWRNLAELGIRLDSTLYFAEQPGFRCGTCRPFPVFDVFTRTEQPLLEVPLTAMEVSWTGYLKKPPDEMLSDLKNLALTVQQHGGTFVLLWHNSSFEVPEFLPYKPVYESLLGFLREIGAVEFV